MSPQLTDFLAGISDVFVPTQIKTDPADLKVWGTDWTRNYPIAPLAVVFPEDVSQVCSLVKRAPELDVQLVPSGGRTGLSGGAVASRQEVVVSLDRMNEILDFNQTDRLVRVQAGVVTAQLQAFAAQHGLFYPVDFASSGSSQIGGNVATNAGGIRVIRYGMTRNWIAGLTVVTGAGEILRLNHGLMKNATGYDLRHLFIGSEGTLGVIVEAIVSLQQPPEPQQVMVLGVSNTDDILRVLEIFQEHVTLSAFEFFSELAMQKVLQHREIQRPFTDSMPFYALLEFDESDSETALDCYVNCSDLGLVRHGVVSESQAQAASLWKLRDGISESIASQTPYKNDISVRTADIPQFLHAVERIVNARYPGFEICWFGHIGDGNVHLNILCPESLSISEFYDRCHAISPEIFALIQEHNGSISAEHGVGLLKKDFLEYSRSPAEIAYMTQLKAIFDPHNVMNPGKLLREYLPQ